MSTLTIPTAAEIARQRLGLAPNDAPRLEVLVPDALKRIGRELKETSDRFLLRRGVNKTPVAGVIDLSDAAFAAVYIDTYRAPGAIRTQADSAMVFNHVPSLNALRASYPKDTNCVWHHLLDVTDLVFRDPTTGALNTYATPLTLVGAIVPDFSTLPASILDDQVTDAIQMLFQQVGGVNFLKMDPEQARSAVQALGVQQPQ